MICSIDSFTGPFEGPPWLELTTCYVCNLWSISRGGPVSPIRLFTDVHRFCSFLTGPRRNMTEHDGTWRNMTEHDGTRRNTTEYYIYIYLYIYIYICIVYIYILHIIYYMYIHIQMNLVLVNNPPPVNKVCSLDAWKCFQRVDRPY